MSKLTSIILIIIFIVSLIVGVSIGLSVAPGEGSDPEPWSTPDTPNLISTVLVLGVNNFVDPEIYLESAWIVTISQSQRSGGNFIDLTLVAIYPGNAQQFTNPEQSEFLQPHDPMAFPKLFLGNPSARELLYSLPVMVDTEIYFQDVVILDEFAMNYLIALTNLNPVLPVQPPPEGSFLLPWDDPQRAHLMQHNILETLCAPPQNLLNYENFLQAFTLIPNHLRTTLSNPRIVAFWQSNINLDPAPTINCGIYP
ncbi:MAG: hypothetical protein ABFS17_13945 [Chloroflexota bacterium]